MLTRNDFKNNWKADLNAGFILFLIAVPLSVGIAIASGAPPSAGLIAAILGGVVGSFLGGGHININAYPVDSPCISFRIVTGFLVAAIPKRV